MVNIDRCKVVQGISCARIAQFQRGQPSPVARKALDLMGQWKEKHGQEVAGVPMPIQDEAWDIAFHPTEDEPLLSRTKKPIGVSVVKARKPSFLG